MDTTINLNDILYRYKHHVSTVTAHIQHVPTGIKTLGLGTTRDEALSDAITKLGVQLGIDVKEGIDVRQPLPVPNDDVSIQSLVRTDLGTREQVGIKKYGTPLQAYNGRDALRDAYEEALDLACYLRQMIRERDNT